MSDTGAAESQGESASTPAVFKCEEGAGDSTIDLESEQPNKEESEALVLPKLSFNSKTGKQVEVPQEVLDRVEKFVVPPGYIRTGSRDKSHIYSWGVNLVPDNSPNPGGSRTKKFFCLANHAYAHSHKPLSTKDSKSGVGKHLNGIHHR